jgi:hypothetical protein
MHDSYKLLQFVDPFLRGKVWPDNIQEHTMPYTQSSAGAAYTGICYEALLTVPLREYCHLLEAVGMKPARQHSECIDPT